jgi:hypothetical protein
MSVRPGEQIPLDTLYSMYGKKHHIKEEDFIAWLKEVKLKGKQDQWLIVETDADYTSEVAKVKEVHKDKIYETNTRGEVVVSKMSVEDVINLPVRKARDVVPTIMDSKLLKYALVEARPRPNKESLCRILEKRIGELGMHL